MTVQFDFHLDGDRVAHCWQVQAQPYQDCTFSAGLVEGLEPDTIYFRFERSGEEPYMFFLRPDEALAIAWLLNGALWSQSVIIDKD